MNGRRYSIPARYIAGFILLAIAPTAAKAATEAVEAHRYADCMAQVGRDPDAAFDTAMGWSYEGGGYPARHCAASALLALKHYAEAATRLEQMAEDMVGAEARLRPSVLQQAAQAWMLQGDLTRSLANYTTALKLAPGEPDLLVGRSTVLALSGHYWEAIDDLNIALEARPDDVEALVMRASAYRLVKNAELAMADVERALTLQPDHPGALLERGNLRRLIGDDDGARADWVRLLQTAPDSVPADAARANLEKLDVKISD